MRYLLLSVLVVCMVGIMIPNVFAETYTVENAPNSTTPGCEKTNECFLPSTLTIVVGDTVIFANTFGIGYQGHTSTSGIPYEEDGVWDSGYTAPGESYSVTLDEAGTYPYHCMMHPWMLGTIIVEGQSQLPTVPISDVESNSEGTSYTGIVLAIIGAIIVGIIVYIRRKRKTSSVCSNCGNTLKPTAKFCAKCGNQV